MTPSELRKRLHEMLETGVMKDDMIDVLNAITDPTPISEEFAKRVRATKRAGLSFFPRHKIWRFWIPKIDDPSEHIFDTHHLTTVGDVNTLLWRAGLLEEVK